MIDLLTVFFFVKKLMQCDVCDELGLGKHTVRDWRSFW